MKCLLISLLLLPTISVADELHLDLDLSKICRKSLDMSYGEKDQKHDEAGEANQEQLLRELIRQMHHPKTMFDDTGNIWWGFPSGLVIPPSKEDE